MTAHRPIMPPPEADLAALRAFLDHTFALLANGIADVEERLNARIDAQAAAAEARLKANLIEVGRQLYDKLESEARDLRQIGHLATRKMGRSSPRIRCVFLVHAVESWDAQIDIYEAMARDPRFDPIVATINRKFPGDGAYGGEAQTSAALDSEGIAHLRLGMEPSFAALDILRALAPDVIFRQSQWEHDVPPAFATERLNFARICSVPYGMSIVAQFSQGQAHPGGVDPQSFDQPYHRAAWRVFCETRQTRDYFVQFHHADPAKFVVSGYPKLSRLLRAREQADRWPVGNPARRRRRVIWAPHYSVRTSWLGFGVFDRIYRDFLDYAAQRPDMEFVLKPHPALFPFAVSSGAMAQADLDGFLAAWRALPNCAVETGTYAHLFAASDMMITDGLSFFTEYPIFEKPLIFFDSGRHVALNALGRQALAAARHVDSFSAMQAAIEEAASPAPWPLEAERRALLTTLFPGERQPVDVILDAIAHGFAIPQTEAA